MRLAVAGAKTVTLTPRLCSSRSAPLSRRERGIRNRRLSRADNSRMPPLLRSSTYRSRALRRAMTPAERALWALLRGRQLGFKFRRQHPLDRFYADFFCFEVALVVEVDGPYHRARRRYDRQRDNFLRLVGIKVLRLTNEEVLHNPDRAILRIRQALANRAGIRYPR